MGKAGGPMKRCALVFGLLAATSGCMEHQLNNEAMRLNKTTPDLIYREILDNVARTIDNPAEMPYFNMPASGTAQIQQALSVTATPGWSLITNGTVHVGSFILNSVTGAVNPQQIDQESWQLSPVADPDRLTLMHAAYLKATGHDCPENEAVLNEYFTNRDLWVEIGIQQTAFSNEVWSVSRDYRARRVAVLDNIPEPRLLKQDANDPKKKFVPLEQSLVCKYLLEEVGRKAFYPNTLPDVKVPDISKELLTQEDWDKVASALTDYTQYYLAMTSLRLRTDYDYQRLAAKYALLSPPPSGQGPAYSSASGGPSGAAGGGAGGAGGKPPLPIHVAYATFVQAGWYNVGKKHDVPKDACFVGHHCDTYVWVGPAQMDALNKFTLAILDFNNIGNSGGSNVPTPPPATLGR